MPHQLHWRTPDITELLLELERDELTTTEEETDELLRDELTLEGMLLAILLTATDELDTLPITP